jgi:EpsI family protein
MLWRAVVVALALLSSAVVIGRSVREQSVSQVQFEELPYKLDGWSGALAERFAPEVLQMAGVDDYLHRQYFSQARQPLWLYVGFYGSQVDGRTMHSPLNCFPGSGWEATDHTVLPVQVSDANGSRTVDVNRLLVRRGADTQVVLYWYQIHGRVVASEYWSKTFTVMDAISRQRTDGAIVRIVTPVVKDETSATTAAAEFVSKVFPSLTAVLPL